ARLTPIVLLLLMVISKLALALRSHPTLGLQHLLGFTRLSSWKSLARIVALQSCRARAIIAELAAHGLVP
ncbi:UNVERIFIED_CONTAM: hypothetical protein NY603_21520, partial [Bacteroidetes bacterium 56_B9]